MCLREGKKHRLAGRWGAPWGADRQAALSKERDLCGPEAAVTSYWWPAAADRR